MHTITARLNHPEAGSIYKDCYCYDEPSINLIAEPLVHQTTKAIHTFLRSEPEVITIHFSDQLTDLPELENSTTLWLSFQAQDELGSTYLAEEMNMGIGLLFDKQVWLCNHLFDYFPTPPKEFYAVIIPK